ncbi:DNA gyrase/topoisomerase IV subunit A [Lacisediminihabitans changchengi]|uniref:DNA topoisomerase (ATP-hydrolyzing) n=1 Tax=Lacisediminihabitans changchengi TaxID=2787634 RepID=A0A934SRC4_9MICO|nr:DNA topoisomerase IV subunit A [Lacisediminihabitans changchengi]MBK4346724.1 DNA topoisomerase IV subunit A [Lacisediminihabitans changchengi]MBK4348153.1 DNA topoisomerase IV subunit A [Lacisediminihabitans changchengi]
MATSDTPTSDAAQQSTAQASTGERIDIVDVSAEMEGSFLEYAYSVIYSRALPDARDGLKPVQRRILYQMTEMGLRPDRGHVKSARVTGEVMGKLHPHGDSSIYDAMVRLAQPFIMRVPLIDGHGNFGTLDDGPAAARYTEARLTAAALAMTQDLDEDVVDFVPNYDAQLQQPEVLPAAFPNLLVNGASGIAVGMATNMAPHNLIEVVGAARHLIDNPNATLDDLMSYVPGPDLPTGGTIIGLAGIRDAYETGRGAFKTRARVSVENITARKAGLVITELPFMVGAEKVIEKIKDGVNSKKLSGISDVTDLTDRAHGTRLVVGIKTGFSPDAVLEQLYRFTPLEDSFNINNVALVDGGPKTLGLKELLQVYIDHRISVVTRRSRFRLARKLDRLHLVEGLLIAILDIDEVIQVIRSSDDTEAARARLIEVFDLSQIQAEYILELRLRRLTKFSRIELETERDQLRAEIAQLQELLAVPQRIRSLVSDELEEIAEKFGTPRRTLLTEARPSIATSSRKSAPILEIADAPCRVLLSTTGRAIRIDLAEEIADEAALPARIARRSKHDAILSALVTTSRAEIGAITNLGRLIKLTPVDLPVVPENSIQLAAGVRITDYLGLDSTRERVLALVSLTSDDPIALGTRQGVVKRLAPGDYPNKPDFEVIALKPGDEVVGARQGGDGDTLLFMTSDAQVLHYAASAVRPQGRTAGGMAGINLGATAEVIFFGVIDPTTEPVVVTVSSSSSALVGVDAGRAKVSYLTEFPSKGRATGGVRAHTFLKGEDVLALGWAGAAPAIPVAPDGAVRALPEAGAKRDASGTPLEGVIGSVGESIASANAWSS